MYFSVVLFLFKCVDSNIYLCTLIQECDISLMTTDSYVLSESDKAFAESLRKV